MYPAGTSRPALYTAGGTSGSVQGYTNISLNLASHSMWNLGPTLQQETEARKGRAGYTPMLMHMHTSACTHTHAHTHAPVPPQLAAICGRLLEVACVQLPALRPSSPQIPSLPSQLYTALLHDEPCFLKGHRVQFFIVVSSHFSGCL